MSKGLVSSFAYIKHVRGILESLSRKACETFLQKSNICNSITKFFLLEAPSHIFRIFQGSFNTQYNCTLTWAKISLFFQLLSHHFLILVRKTFLMISSLIQKKNNNFPDVHNTLPLTTNKRITIIYRAKKRKKNYKKKTTQFIYLYAFERLFRYTYTNK